MVNPKESWNTVLALEQAIADGKAGLDTIPKLVVRIVEDGFWREFLCHPTGSMVRHETFESFVTSDIPEGLDMDIRTLKNLCRDDMQALDAIDRATQRPHGGEHTKIDNINLASPVPSGTSRDAALRRLRKDRPDLHEAVMQNEMSAHAAMVEAGFRKKPTPDDLVAAAVRKFESKLLAVRVILDQCDRDELVAIRDMMDELLGESERQ